LIHRGEIASMRVCCVARLVVSGSLPVSVKTIVQKRRIFQCCNGCSVCFDFFILTLFLNLFAFSALVSAFQFFTRKHCLQFSELNMCSVTPRVYNLLLLPAALLLLIWSTAANEFELCLCDTAKCQPPQNTFKHKLSIHSTTLCDITIQIVTHRVDCFSCLALVAFVLLQYTPARRSNLIL